MQVLIILSIQTVDISNFIFTHFKLKTNFKFQIFKLYTESLWNKGESKKKRERNDGDNCLIGFLRGQFLDSKGKAIGNALNNILGVL